MNELSTETLPQGFLPVTIRPLGGLTPVEDDIFAVASIDCPMLGLTNAVLLLAPRHNVVTLASPCGCHVDVEISRLILALSEVLRKAEHGGAGSATAH
jgi:hypothetical protein